MALGEQEVPKTGHPGQQRGRLLHEEGALLSSLMTIHLLPSLMTIYLLSSLMTIDLLLNPVWVHR